MYIHTTSIQIDMYGQGTVLRCPSYSKILHVQIRSTNNTLVVTYQSESYVGSSFEPSWKSFSFKVLKGIWQSNAPIPFDYEYFDTVKVMDDDMIEYYHIFVQEIKTLEEQRDGKIQDLIDQNQDF